MTEPAVRQTVTVEGVSLREFLERRPDLDLDLTLEVDVEESPGCSPDVTIAEVALDPPDNEVVFALAADVADRAARLATEGLDAEREFSRETDADLRRRGL